jgi:Tfp pilus assembly protein PilO
VTVNKRTLAIAGAIAGAALILLLYALIVRGIAGERKHQGDIEAQLEPFEMALDAQQQGADVLPTRQAELESLKAELAEIQFAFPSEVNTTKVLSYIYTSATQSGVDVRQLEARRPVTEAIGGQVYRLFAYDVEVQGGLEQTAAFLAALEREAIETMAVDGILTEAQPTPGSYRTKLTVMVYVRPKEGQSSE